MWWSLSSDLAVDGNTDPDINNKHCSATFRPRLVPPTCSESSSWWMVDLGYLSAVEKVVIYSSAKGEYKKGASRRMLCISSRRGRMILLVFFVTFILSAGARSPDTLAYISVRVSNSSEITSHTAENECAFWNSNRFPNASSETLTCRDTMVGSFVSVQRHDGENPHSLVLCEVVVIGKRLDYGKKQWLW